MGPGEPWWWWRADGGLGTNQRVVVTCWWWWMARWMLGNHQRVVVTRWWWCRADGGQMEPGEPPKSRRDSLVVVDGRRGLGNRGGGGWQDGGLRTHQRVDVTRWWWWRARWRAGNPPTSRRDSLVVLQGRWRADGAWGTVVVVEGQEPTNESS